MKTVLPNLVLAHPSGNQFFRHLALALRDERMLAHLCTALDWRGGAWERFLPRGVQAELSRRRFSADLGVRVMQHPWRELSRLAAGRLGLDALVRHERGWLSVDAVYRDFDAWVAAKLPEFEGANAVYAYEDAAESTFAAATRLGWRKIYDLPIAYWSMSRRLLEEEAQRWPEWEPTLLGNRDSVAKLERKTREFEAADVVVCPSRFVADSLPTGRSTKRVVIAPFGSPASASPPRSEPAVNRPLRILFVGSMTQRKGLADLFAAMRLLRRDDVELAVLGSPVASSDFYRQQFRAFHYVPPRPHAEVLTFMRTCDVLCLPSIVEGRALVVQEAMSAGLPAIVTANTGTDDVIEEGRSGFIVPIRSPESLAAKIAWFADNRPVLPEMARDAQAAAARFTWGAYAQTIVDALSYSQDPSSQNAFV